MNEFSNIAHIFFCIKSHIYFRDELLELPFSYPQFLYLGMVFAMNFLSYPSPTLNSYTLVWKRVTFPFDKIPVISPHNVLQFQLRFHISKPTKMSVGCFWAVVLSLLILLGCEIEFLDAKAIVYMPTANQRK